MAGEGEEWIVVFESTHAALAAERAARRAGVPVRMSPVPRRISTDCNTGMRVPREHRHGLELVLRGANVECRFVPLDPETRH
ncbi:MAG: DUF3343 domain-containing protein [Lentisphaerae bacterium]|nr:DUF3343 domain-containing protein [Lentisphaerota bacterium]